MLQLRMSESLRYRKYLSVNIAWIRGDIRFTSHVLMCVDSHSWRMESSCSMLDIYCFSRGKNSINSPNVLATLSHNFQNVFFDTARQRLLFLDSPLKPRSKCGSIYIKSTSGKPQRPRIFFVLTSFNCSFSTLFGFVGHLVEKDISLISDHF